MSYRRYSYEEYQYAMELLNNGCGLTETCRRLGWPETRKTTLWEWRHGRHKPPTTRWVPKPSNELAYIIGVLYGDGCVKVHGHHYDIKLNTVDYEFADKFSRALAKLLAKNVVRPVWIGLRRGRNYGWEVTYSSIAFYTWYKNQALETSKPYIEHNKGTAKQFLRGLYDSEGCNYRCRRISLYNNDVELLKYVQYLLKKYFDIIAIGPHLHIRAGRISIKRNGEKIKAKKNNYYIAISRRQHVKRFLDEVGFSIQEKQLGLPRRK